MTGWPQHEAEMAEDAEFAKQGEADATAGNPRRLNNPAYVQAYLAHVHGHRPGHKVYGYGQSHLDGYGCRGCEWQSSNYLMDQSDAEAKHDDEMHLDPTIASGSITFTQKSVLSTSDRAVLKAEVTRANALMKMLDEKKDRSAAHFALRQMTLLVGVLLNTAD